MWWLLRLSSLKHALTYISLLKVSIEFDLLMKKEDSRGIFMNNWIKWSTAVIQSCSSISSPGLAIKHDMRNDSKEGTIIIHFMQLYALHVRCHPYVFVFFR